MNAPEIRPSTRLGGYEIELRLRFKILPTTTDPDIHDTADAARSVLLNSFRSVAYHGMNTEEHARTVQTWERAIVGASVREL